MLFVRNYELRFILYVWLMSQLAQDKPIKQHSRQQLCPRDTLVIPLEDDHWETIKSVTLCHPELPSCLWRKTVPEYEVSKMLSRSTRLDFGAGARDKEIGWVMIKGLYSICPFQRSVGYIPRLILDTQIRAGSAQIRRRCLSGHFHDLNMINTMSNTWTTSGNLVVKSHVLSSLFKKITC